MDTSTNDPTDPIVALSRILFEELRQQHGSVLGGAALYKALGFASAAALRQARRRGLVQVPLFRMPQRRGVYALTNEVAFWLARARLDPSCRASSGGPPIE